MKFRKLRKQANLPFISLHRYKPHSQNVFYLLRCGAGDEVAHQFFIKKFINTTTILTSSEGQKMVYVFSRK